MADIRSNFLGIKSPELVLVSLRHRRLTKSITWYAPSKQAGVAGLKTLGIDPAVVNVMAHATAPTAGLNHRSFNNIEPITDRSLETNSKRSPA